MEHFNVDPQDSQTKPLHLKDNQRRAYVKPVPWIRYAKVSTGIANSPNSNESRQANFAVMLFP
jgi:hypothetical protein